MDTQGQHGNQLEKPAVDTSNSRTVNKGFVHKMGLMCHFIKQRKMTFLKGTEIQLLFGDCGYAPVRREELIPNRAHMCSGSRNWRKES